MISTLPNVPRFVYNDGNPVDYHASLPSRAWTPGTSTVGGSDVSGAGVPAAFLVRRDHPWGHTLRFPEREWPNVERMIAHGQSGGTITLYPDRLHPTSKSVYLVSPAMGEDVRPNRLGDEQGTMELDIVVRPTTDAVVRDHYYGRALWRYSAGDDARGVIFTRPGSIGAYRSYDEPLAHAGANQLRTTWRRVNGVLRRYTLLEVPRTNALTFTEDLANAAWTKSGLDGSTPIVVNQGVGPTGAVILDALKEDTSTTSKLVGQAATMTADVPYALSAWASANARSWCRLVIFETAAAGNNVQAYFNLATGAVGTTADNGTGTLVGAYLEDWTSMAPGLYRVVVMGSVGNGATGITGYLLAQTQDAETTYLGDGSNAINGGCPQLEHGREASSYIPRLDATAASRGAEAFSSPFLWTPRQLADMGGVTFYLDFINGMVPPWTTEGGVSRRLLHLGNATNSLPLLSFRATTGSDDYLIAHNNNQGAGEVNSAVDLNPTRGDRIQLAGQFFDDGSVQIHGRKNGVTSASGSRSAAEAPASAWSGQLIHLGGVGTTGRGIQEYADAAVFPGLLSIDECEREARAS